MAKKIGSCQYCPAKNIELQRSHIIPEFCYKRVYTRKHKLKSFSIQKNSSLKMEQKGYREYLLCSTCEGIFSKWEDSLSQFMEDIISGNQKKLTTIKIKEFEVIRGFNYEHIKRAILSILWRLGISTLPVFEQYDMGPYQSKLKKYFDQVQV